MWSWIEWWNVRFDDQKFQIFVHVDCLCISKIFCPRRAAFKCRMQFIAVCYLLLHSLQRFFGSGRAYVLFHGHKLADEVYSYTRNNFLAQFHTGRNCTCCRLTYRHMQLDFPVASSAAVFRRDAGQWSPMRLPIYKAQQVVWCAAQVH